MARIGRPPKSLEERFWAKVDKRSDNECWTWKGARHTQGYGLIKRQDGTQLRAHRVAYELMHETVPEGMMVCHKCDNTSCVNPAHLFLCDALVNTRDMIAKGRKVVCFGERNGSTKITDEQVIKIRQDRRKQDEIAAENGIAQSTVSMIKRRKRRNYA